MQFITEEEYITLCDGEWEGANEIIERVGHRLVEETLRALPHVISQLLKSATVIKNLSQEFYDSHPDLVGHKELVGRWIEKTETEFPGLPIDQVLAKVAREVRRLIKLELPTGVVQKPLQGRLNELARSL